jgi:hypothetical protein
MVKCIFCDHFLVIIWFCPNTVKSQWKCRMCICRSQGRSGSVSSRWSSGHTELTIAWPCPQFRSRMPCSGERIGNQHSRRNFARRWQIFSLAPYVVDITGRGRSPSWWEHNDSNRYKWSFKPVTQFPVWISFSFILLFQKITVLDQVQQGTVAVDPAEDPMPCPAIFRRMKSTSGPPPDFLSQYKLERTLAPNRELSYWLQRQFSWTIRSSVCCQRMSTFPVPKEMLTAKVSRTSTPGRPSEARIVRFVSRCQHKDFGPLGIASNFLVHFTLMMQITAHWSWSSSSRRGGDWFFFLYFYFFVSPKIAAVNEFGDTSLLLTTGCFIYFEGKAISPWFTILDLREVSASLWDLWCSINLTLSMCPYVKVLFHPGFVSWLSRKPTAFSLCFDYYLFFERFICANFMFGSCEHAKNNLRLNSRVLEHADYNQTEHRVHVLFSRTGATSLIGMVSVRVCHSKNKKKGATQCYWVLCMPSDFIHVAALENQQLVSISGCRRSFAFSFFFLFF